MTPDVVVYSLRLLALFWGPSGGRGHRELRGFASNKCSVEDVVRLKYG